MKKINSFNINTTAISNAATSRAYSVAGEPGAVFSLVVTNNAGQFYNFPEKTVVSEDSDTVRPAPSFSSTATKLSKQEIGSSGIYNSIIEFPASSSDDKYTVTLQAESGYNTTFSQNLSSSNIFNAAEIYQYADTTITFAVASNGSSGTYTANPPASNYAVTGPSTSVSKTDFNKKISISWAVALSSSQFVIARQPQLNDFFFTTTKTTSTTGSGVAVELDDVSGLSVGMAVSGTGIAASNFIKDIKLGYKDENQSTSENHVYVSPKSIDSSGKNITDSTAGTIFISNSSTWDPDVTLTTIPITSTNGIKAAEGVIMSGIGVTGAPHVDAVSAGVNVTASSAQTIENGQTVTFTGSSRNATITADVVVKRFGKDNLTITLELDNILTVG